MEVRMDLVYLKKLIKIFDDSHATALELDEKGIKIHLSKTVNLSHEQTSINQPYFAHSHLQPAQHHIEPNTINTSISSVSNSKETEVNVPNNLHTLLSPIVGTFYMSPSPESPSFVEIGSRVTKGQTLCIIEAMKLMNEIESDVDGIIEKILVQNAQPVEYNQPLFIINPAK